MLVSVHRMLRQGMFDRFRLARRCKGWRNMQSGGTAILNSLRIVMVFLVAGMSLATDPAFGEESPEDLQAMARLFAALEARNQKAYCATMQSPAYTDYLSRVCQTNVKNTLKKSEDCAAERVALEVKASAEQCLALSPDELEKVALRWQDSRKAVFEQMTAEGLNGEKLMREERSRLP